MYQNDHIKNLPVVTIWFYNEHAVMHPYDAAADEMANTVDPDLTVLLQCLIEPICPNSWNFHINFFSKVIF